MTISAIPGADADTAPSRHARLLDWVREVAELTTPERIEWCDGSPEEWARITDLLVEAGTFRRLDPAKKPNSFALASSGLVPRVLMPFIRS